MISPGVYLYLGVLVTVYYSFNSKISAPSFYGHRLCKVTKPVGIGVKCLFFGKLFRNMWLHLNVVSIDLQKQ